MAAREICALLVAAALIFCVALAVLTVARVVVTLAFALPAQAGLMQGGDDA